MASNQRLISALFSWVDISNSPSAPLSAGERSAPRGTFLSSIENAAVSWLADSQGLGFGVGLELRTETELAAASSGA
jgi:hypothetical protein